MNHQAHGQRPNGPVEQSVIDFFCPAGAVAPVRVGGEGQNQRRHRIISEPRLSAAIDDIMTAMAENRYGQTEVNDMLATLASLQRDVASATLRGIS